MIFEIDKLIDGDWDFKVTEKSSHFKIDHPDCALCQDVAIEGNLKRVGPDIYLSGWVSTELETICTRCLEAIRLPVRAEISTKYIPKAEADELEPEHELHEADIDTEIYSGDKIDTTNTVVDQIVLAIPLVCLCKEDCLGLCLECGKNLNLGPCGCSRKETTDPRLSALLALKNKLK
jgi:uncharacterized protein